MVATVIICIVIAVAAVFAARRAVRTFSGDGSCWWEETHEEGLLLMLRGRKREEGFPREAFE